MRTRRTVFVDGGERDQLLAAVARGQMLTSEAEYQAKRLGLILKSSPSDEESDPMKEAMWSLSMAIAWIVWKDPSKVRDIWTDFRSQCLRWCKIGPQDSVTYLNFDGDPMHSAADDETDPDPHWTETGFDGACQTSGGWLLVPLEPVIVSGLEFEWKAEPADTGGNSVPVKAAIRDLWEKLLGSELVGIGICLKTGDPREIPPGEWPFLKPPESGIDDFLLIDGALRYQDVRLSKKSIIECWPASSATSLSRPVSPKALIGSVGRPTPQQDKATKALKALFGSKYPDKSDMRNAKLISQVQAWLSTNGYPKETQPSRESILRAAGRK